MTRCLTCGRPIQETRHGWIHKSGTAAANAHPAEPISTTPQPISPSQAEAHDDKRTFCA